MTSEYKPQKHEWGKDASDDYARKLTPGQEPMKKERKKKMRSFNEHMDIEEKLDLADYDFISEFPGELDPPKRGELVMKYDHKQTKKDLKTVKKIHRDWVTKLKIPSKSEISFLEKLRKIVPNEIKKVEKAMEYANDFDNRAGDDPQAWVRRQTKDAMRLYRKWEDWVDDQEEILDLIDDLGSME